MLELGEGFGGEVSTPLTGFPTGGAQSPSQWALQNLMGRA